MSNIEATASTIEPPIEHPKRGKLKAVLSTLGVLFVFALTWLSFYVDAYMQHRQVTPKDKIFIVMFGIYFLGGIFNLNGKPKIAEGTYTMAFGFVLATAIMCILGVI